MGFLQSIFGSNTGAGYQASGLTSQDLQSAQQNIGNSQQQQQQLLNALQGQNGIQNQSNVYSQLQGVANGTGPNPAQAMLNQTTGQNVAQQASLMAGQRGAASNVGLMARQAAQQGSGIQQQAAGQAATLQAQQSLNALSGMGSLATQQVGQQQSAVQGLANTALQNQANMYSLQGNINTTNAAIAQGNQKAQSGLIGGVLGSVGAGGASVGGSSTGYAGGGEVRQRYDQGGLTATPISGYQAPSNKPQSMMGQYVQNMQQGAMTQDSGKSGYQSGQGLYNLGKMGYNAVFGNASKPSGFTPDTATQALRDSAGTSTKPLGDVAMEQSAGTSSDPSILGAGQSTGVGAADAADAAEGASAAEGAEEGGDATEALAALFAKGGKVRIRFDEGGGVNTQLMNSGAKDNQPDPSTISGTLEDVMSYLAKGGKVPAMVSPGEIYLNPAEVRKVMQGANPQKVGEKIPGQAKVAGNDYKNDTVKKTLDKGGIVVPRTDVNTPEAAKRFVAATLSKKKK